MTLLITNKTTLTTLTTMGDIVVIESEESENSIVEVEISKKPSPPFINLEDEEIILNVKRDYQENDLAKDFIERDKEMSVLSKRTKNSQPLNSPNHWTADMKKFYDDDWGDEEFFIVEKIQEKMDKTPSLWKVSRKDTLSMQNKIRRRNIRCRNCNQQGHHFSLCPDPPHIPKCHMCGCEGHLEHCCPNSKCLNCGNRSKEYVISCYKCRGQGSEICSRCQTIGHNFINCPDHWRLFHLTTGTTSVIIPDRNIYKAIKDIWCCNCGKKGHYQIQCIQGRNFSAFKDTLPFVVSYKNAFNDNHLTNKPNGKRKRRHKGRRKKEDKLEKILRLNPMHQALGKDKPNLKNKFCRPRTKRNKKGKREDQSLWNILPL